MLESTYHRILLQTGASLVLYVIFSGMAVVNVFAPNVVLKYGVLVPIIAALLILPRAIYPKSEPDDTVEKTYYKRLVRIGIWLTYTRALYFFGAVALLFGFPRLVG